MVTALQCIQQLNAMGIAIFVSDGKLKTKAQTGTLTAEVASLIRQHKDELLQLLSEPEAAQPTLMPAISKADRTTAIPLSFAQQRLWLLDQIEGQSSQYHICGALLLHGDPDIAALQASFDQVLARHQVLRTVYLKNDNGELWQQVLPHQPLPLHWHDATDWDDTTLYSRMAQCQAEVFALDRDIMLRVHLYSRPGQQLVVQLIMHHIASDGWSIGVLVQEFSALYQAFYLGKPASLPILDIQYSDYACWQRTYLQGEVLASQLQYWQQQLADLPELHSLPLDKPRPQTLSYAGASVGSFLGAAVCARFKELCRQHGATLFMGLHAAFSVLIARYSGDNDIVIGSPVANREQADVAGLIGFFVNTLVLRLRLDVQSDFISVLEQSRDCCLGAYAHQQVPFEKLVESLQVGRSMSHSPLFQLMLVLQNNDEGVLTLPGLQLQVLPTASTTAQFDLTMNVSESADGLYVDWNYNTALFEEETVRRLAGHFETLLSGILAEPTAPVLAIPLLSAAENAQRLAWNASAYQHPVDQCMHQLFVSKVVQTPEAVALIDAEGSLSYAALYLQAAALSSQLLQQGVATEQLVAIRMPKGRGQLIATLAVLMAGAAYLPLEISWPTERCEQIIRTAQVSLLVVQTESHQLAVQGLSHLLWQAVAVDFNTPAVVSQATRFKPRQRPDQLAYVIFTSGSTGVPKGVAIEHAAVVNTLLDINLRYGVTAKDKVLAVSALSFDLSVYDFFGLLAAGGTVVIPKDELARDPAHWLALVEQQGVTLWNTVPLSAGLLVDQLEMQQPLSISSLRLVMMSGDWIPTTLPRRLWQAFPAAGLYSLGGATEASIWSIHYPITMDTSELRSVPYGKPLSGQQFYVLNSALQANPQGVTGELFIGGRGIAREYYQSAGLTAKQFIQHPQWGCRLYRTGDLGRYLPDGNIEFVGRLDNQLKVRGFRVELGDIESQLSLHPAVDDVLVLARQDGPGLTRLFAYVIVKAGCELPTPEELRTYLKALLPDYMIPAAFMLLDTFPLTSNGKLDRKALPEPDLSQQQAVYQPPQTAIEQSLAQLWQQILGLEQVGLLDNFFALGGHSILVMQLVSQARQRGLILDARQVFSAENLQELAALAQEDVGQPQFQPPHLNLAATQIPAGCSSITPDMLPLISLDEQEIRTITSQVRGGAANIQDIYPLTALQQGFLFHYLLGQEVDPYILDTLVRLESKEGLEQLIQALSLIMQRHDVLRTQLVWQGLEQPVQVVCRTAELQVTEVELDADLHENAICQRLLLSGVSRMDLAKAPLIHLVAGQQTGSGHWYLLLQSHHLIQDHIGLEVLNTELLTILSGRAEQLPVPRQFREHIVRQQQMNNQHQAEAYFRTLLSGFDSPAFPYGMADIQGDGQSLSEQSYQLPESELTRVRLVARQCKTSPAVLFHLVWASVLGLCSARKDVVFGTVMSGRMHGDEGVEAIMGPMINTLPVRVQLDQLNPQQKLVEVQEQLQQLMHYEQTGLTTIQQVTAVPMGTPLFSALLNYRHSAQSDAVVGGIEILLDEEKTNYVLDFTVDEQKHALSLRVKSKNDRASAVLQMILQALELLLSELEQAGESSSEALATAPADELRLMDGWNETTALWPSESQIQQLFSLQVQENPDNIAVVCGEQSLSYVELDYKANQLAHYLKREYGAAAGERVGICLTQGFEQVISVLAVLKTGAAYVPMDPAYPQQRLQYICADARLSVVLTDHQGAEALGQISAAKMFLSQTDLTDESTLTPTAGSSRDLAYVIYTSGSTGQPKGVMVEHSGVLNYLSDIKQRYFSRLRHAVVSTPLAFDATVTSLFGPWLVGGHCLLQPDHDLQSLAETLTTAQQAMVWKLTPAHLDALQALLNHSSALAHCFVVGGDQLNHSTAVAWLQQFFPNAELVNEYGPTETVVGCTAQQENLETLLQADCTNVLIGQALQNTRLYILNDALQRVPLGVAGELYIGGAGVAPGYLNKPELTAEKFICSPFCSGERLYRSGDLVRLRPSGELEYLGRNDFQLKIRGYRIEPGEIEAAMQSCGADIAVVTAHTDNHGNSLLVGYFRATSLSGELLRDRLQAQLPAHLVPTLLIQVEQFVLTTNGKIDRKALPAPDIQAMRQDFVAPATATERTLANIWQQLLQVESVGRKDDFFALGGHSLLATRLASQINKQFGVMMPLSILFNASRLSVLAGYLDTLLLNADTTVASDEDIVEEGFL